MDGCYGESSTAEQVVMNSPVALYIMLDASGSMDEQSGATSKWDAAVSGLTAFVTDPNSEGIDVAFNEFANGIAFLDFNCTGSQYANALVGMGKLLQPNGPLIIDALANTGPNGIGTNIEPGLNVSVESCKAWQAMTGEKCVAVFISDGQPNACSTDHAYLASLAGNAFTQFGVQTFAVAMAGADFNLMNAIAQAGGSDCDPNGPNFACDITADASGFINALRTIRQTVTVTAPVPCEWAIPLPLPGGQVFDPNLVNVEYTVGGSSATPIGAVNGPADCANVANAWHYDDPANPTKVMVCPQTCTTIQGIADVRVDVIFGCETVIAIM